MAGFEIKHLRFKSHLKFEDILFSTNTLLNVKQGSEGTFVDWLKKLGLDDFIWRYSLPKIIEWGWLVPYSRVIFPNAFFHEHPHTQEELNNFKAESLLWDSSWWIDEQEPLWFLHPWFKAADHCYERLHYSKSLATFPDPPEAFKLPNNHKITPYVDYFFHWQAYALIDVIRMATWYPILETPDINLRIENRLAHASDYKNNNPSIILTQENKWGGLATIMTALSHYQSFCRALQWNDNRAKLKQEGAIQLADFLGITATMLESAIKDKLLVLAQSWLKANERYCIWTIRAWPFLQTDIEDALEWLCLLNGKTFSDYLEQWVNTSRMNEGWAELKAVLPYEFFENRQYFLNYIPYYDKHFKSLLPVDEQLKQLVTKLQTTNYPFGSFLAAFRQLHKHLFYKPQQEGGLDFREQRPLDYYSLLAIRAEGCLREALDKNGSLATMPTEQQGLRGYIIEIAKQKKLSLKVINYFETNANELTHFGKMPTNPISKIIETKPKNCTKTDVQLVQAFLCCLLARNYFAHHTYLDQELTQTNESGFMLTGILVTVLTLLE